MGQIVRGRRSLASLILVACALLFTSPAYALDLVEADPVVNSTITSAPSAITMRLSGEIVETGSSMSVRAPSGKLVDDGSLLIDGAQALIGLGTLSEGYYLRTKGDLCLHTFGLLQLPIRSGQRDSYQRHRCHRAYRAIG